MNISKEEAKQLTNANRKITEALKNISEALDRLGKMPSYYDETDPNHRDTVRKYNQLTTVYITLSDLIA